MHFSTMKNGDYYRLFLHPSSQGNCPMSWLVLGSQCKNITVAWLPALANYSCNLHEGEGGEMTRWITWDSMSLENQITNESVGKDSLMTRDHGEEVRLMNCMSDGWCTGFRLVDNGKPFSEWVKLVALQSIWKGQPIRRRQRHSNFTHDNFFTQV